MATGNSQKLFGALLAALLLASCAGTEKPDFVSGPLREAATVKVVGNYSALGDLLTTVFTLGLVKPPEETVTIRRVNGQDADAERLQIDPGPCRLELAYSGENGRRSSALLPLQFDAKPGQTYAIRWSAGTEHWKAGVGGLAQVEGDVLVPIPQEIKSAGDLGGRWKIPGPDDQPASSPSRRTRKHSSGSGGQGAVAGQPQESSTSSGNGSQSQQDPASWGQEAQQ